MVDDAGLDTYAGPNRRQRRFAKYGHKNRLMTKKGYRNGILIKGKRK